MRKAGIWFGIGMLLMGIAGCKETSKFQFTQWTKDEGLPANIINLLLVDERGKPVSGAVAGGWPEGWDAGQIDCADLAAKLRGARIQISADAEGVLHYHTPSTPPVQTSGPDGSITIPATNLFGYGFIFDWQSNRYEVLSVVHSGRRIGACISLLPKDLGSRSKVTLVPLRVVSGTIADENGAKLTHVQTTLMTVPPGPLVCFGGYKSTSGRYAFLVPPGSYSLLVMLPNARQFQMFPLTVQSSDCQMDVILAKRKATDAEPVSAGDSSTRDAGFGTPEK